MQLFLLQIFLRYSVLVSLPISSRTAEAEGAQAYFYAQYLFSFSI